jgi:hypothetical protein
MWVRLDALPAPTKRFGLVDNNGQYGVFVGENGKIRCSIGATVPTALQLVVGTWTHIACTYDGAAVTMYQDGVAGSTTPTTVTMTTGGTEGLRLGMNSPDKDELVGALDDVRIFRVARTAEEVCAAADRVACE